MRTTQILYKDTLTLNHSAQLQLPNIVFFLKYWHEAFISEVKIPYNCNLTQHNLPRIGTITAIQRNGQKLCQRQQSQYSRPCIPRWRANSILTAFFQLFLIALVKWLLRTIIPSLHLRSGRHYLARFDPDQDFLTKQRRPHCQAYSTMLTCSVFFSTQFVLSLCPNYFFDVST